MFSFAQSIRPLLHIACGTQKICIWQSQCNPRHFHPAVQFHFHPYGILEYQKPQPLPASVSTGTGGGEGVRRLNRLKTSPWFWFFFYWWTIGNWHSLCCSGPIRNSHPSPEFASLLNFISFRFINKIRPFVITL